MSRLLDSQTVNLACFLSLSLFLSERHSLIYFCTAQNFRFLPLRQAGWQAVGWGEGAAQGVSRLFVAA